MCRRGGEVPPCHQEHELLSRRWFARRLRLHGRRLFHGSRALLLAGAQIARFAAQDRSSPASHQIYPLGSPRLGFVVAPRLQMRAVA